MAVLAQERNSLYQHRGLGGAVRIMAIYAAIPDRVVFPQKWSALFSMALVTGFNNCIFD
jgi:hypothetical protein